MNIYFKKICFVIIGFMMVSSFVFAQDKTGPVTPQNKQLADECIGGDGRNITISDIPFVLTDSRQYVNGSDISVLYTFTLNDKMVEERIKKDKWLVTAGKVRSQKEMYQNFKNLGSDFKNNGYDTFVNICKKSIDDLNIDPNYFIGNPYRTTDEGLQKYKDSPEFYDDIMTYIKTGNRARYYYNKDYAQRMRAWHKWFYKYSEDDAFGRVGIDGVDYAEWYFANGKKGTEDEYNALKAIGEEPIPEDIKSYEKEIEDYKELLSFGKNFKAISDGVYFSSTSMLAIINYYWAYHIVGFEEKSKVLSHAFFKQYVNDYIKFAKDNIGEYEDLFRINREIPKIQEEYDRLYKEKKVVYDDIWLYFFSEKGSTARIKESAEAFELENPFWQRYYDVCDDFKYKKMANEERELLFSKLIDKDSIRMQCLFESRIVVKRDSKGVLQKNLLYSYPDLQLIITFDVHPEPGKTETVFIPLESFPKEWLVN